MYDNPSTNILSENLKAFPLKSGTRQGRPLSPLLLNTVLDGPARAIRTEKEIKAYKIIQRKKWSSLFAGDMLLFIENPKDSHQKTELINEFSQVAWYKFRTLNSLAFLCMNNELWEGKIKKAILFIVASKRIKYLRSKFNQGDERRVYWKLEEIIKDSKEDTNEWKDILCS